MEDKKQANNKDLEIGGMGDASTSKNTNSVGKGLIKTTGITMPTGPQGDSATNTAISTHQENIQAFKKLNIEGTTSSPPTNTDTKVVDRAEEADYDWVTPYNHEKAQKIYKEYDPYEIMTKEIIQKMQKSVVLHDCARKIGGEISNSSRNINLNDLQENIIAAAEAIHHGLQDETIRNRFTGYYDNLPNDTHARDDRLFGIALHNLYHALHEHQYEIIGQVDEIYGVE